MKATNRRHFDSTAYVRPAGAFTMVEMLAVMFIITMLLAIGVPTALRYRAQARARATQKIINQIDQAVRMYYNEHHEYPAANNLTQCLTGYKDDDGKKGYGYRVQKRGRVLGPWNGTEKLSRSGEHFMDSYGTAIEYHPFRIADGNYADTGVNTYAKDAEDRYYRRDYVLRSKGENGDFEEHPHTYTSGSDEIIPDDITNFFEE